GFGLGLYGHRLIQAGRLEMQIERTQFADAELDVRYGQLTETWRGHHDVVRSRQQAVDEVESLFVCYGLAYSLGLRIENTYGRPAHDGAGGIVSRAADAAAIRLRLEKTCHLEKTCQDK